MTIISVVQEITIISIVQEMTIIERKKSVGIMEREEGKQIQVSHADIAQGTCEIVRKQTGLQPNISMKVCTTTLMPYFSLKKLYASIK